MAKQKPAEPVNPAEQTPAPPKAKTDDPWLVNVARQIDESARAVADATTGVAKKVFGKAAREERAKAEKEVLELFEAVHKRLHDLVESGPRLRDLEIWKSIERLYALRHVSKPPPPPKEDVAPAAEAPPAKDEGVLDAEVVQKDEPSPKKE